MSLGYYDQFPPKSMNVSVKQFGSKEERNGQTLTHVLVANKSFKAGEIIYKVGRDGVMPYYFY